MFNIKRKCGWVYEITFPKSGYSILYKMTVVAEAEDQAREKIEKLYKDKHKLGFKAIFLHETDVWE